ncbi:DegV family protein [Cellulosilyticum ruminicola]|uniref:DegV family protein n=1 Tax=Cellulosilyticum ruminicola TaxID=425254 RepID=UPI0006D04E18|nr:DegV family protein [Cellulosilyticum ruminicola]
MKYGIVVDSGCDLTCLEHPTLINKIDFARAPLKLDVGETEFVDDFNLNIEKFMAQMYAYDGKTGSAAPSPQTWLSAYEKSEYVFAITITSGLSGSYNSAQIAADLFKTLYPERKIYVIDSKSAGPEITLIVRKLTEYINASMSFDEIVESIENYRKNTHLLFVLQSLDNFIKNGRVSKLQGTMQVF